MSDRKFVFNTKVSMVCSYRAYSMRENIKTPFKRPFVRETTGNRWIPVAKGRWNGKRHDVNISYRAYISMGTETCIEAIGFAIVSNQL